MATFKETVMAMATIDDYGEIDFACLEDYMEAFGMGEQETDKILDDVIESLIDDGVIERGNGTYYVVDIVRQNEEAERELEEAHMNYLSDIEAAWRMAKGYR